jgi:hypothetical protein
VIRSRRVWDRLEITNAFFELPHEGGDGNAIDELKRSKRA